MTYSKFKIKSKEFWTAQPTTWEELSFTIHNEKPIMTYDPNNIQPDNELLNMFL